MFGSNFGEIIFILANYFDVKKIQTIAISDEAGILPICGTSFPMQNNEHFVVKNGDVNLVTKRLEL